MPPSTWMHDLATSTAPSKHDRHGDVGGERPLLVVAAPATPRDVPRGRGDGLGGLEHLGAQVLDRLEGADLLAELLADLGVVDRRRQAPARDPGGLGGGQRDRRTAEQVGRQVGYGDPGRLVDHPRRTEPAAQVEPDRRGRLDRVARVDRPGAGGVGEQHVGGRRQVPDHVGRARCRRPRPPAAPGSDERGDRRAEQRPGHQLVGARLERHGDVQHRTATAAGRLGQPDGRDAHLLRRPARRRRTSRPRRPRRRAPARGPAGRPPTCAGSRPARRARRRSRSTCASSRR